VTDGCAGENILIETERQITLEDIAGGVAIQPAGGNSLVWLRVTQVAAPCRPFSGFVTHVTEAAVVKETLQFLDDGVRGFYCAWRAEPATCLGDRVLIRRESFENLLFPPQTCYTLFPAGVSGIIPERKEARHATVRRCPLCTSPFFSRRNP
jgi:hypothetical protein